MDVAGWRDGTVPRVRRAMGTRPRTAPVERLPLVERLPPRPEPRLLDLRLPCLEQQRCLNMSMRSDSRNEVLGTSGIAETRERVACAACTERPLDKSMSTPLGRSGMTVHE